MLDKIRERAHSGFAKVLLIFIAVTFGVWGVESYIQGSAATDTVATVNGWKISGGEFNETLKRQTDRMREMLGGKLDAEMVNTPEFKRSVMEGLVNQRLLLNNGMKSGLLISDAQLAAQIAQIEEFQQDGEFSKARYQRVLESQGRTPASFDAALRQDLLLQQFRDAYVNSGLVSRLALERLAKISEQQREVSVASVPAEKFTAQVKVDEQAAKKYYDTHQDEFRIPEQAKLEFLLFSADSLAKDIPVEDKEIEEYYQQHEKDYVQKEERQASHILLSLAPDAPAAEKSATKGKAEELLQQVKANPDSFAELAEKFSQDPGSAKQGGDLGFFARGAMVAAFDEAVFKMAEGEIAGPVETEFGYHIIKLIAIQPEKGKTLAEAREEILAELRKQKAGRKFAEDAERFNNLVYEQSGSLKPAAEALKLTLQTSDWLKKGSGGAADPLLNNSKLLEAVFSDQVVKEKRNTEAIEVAANTLIAARVVDFKPSMVTPFVALAAAIKEGLVREEASKLAVKSGQAALQQLKASQQVADLNWSEARTVSRQNPGDAQPYLNTIFAADTAKLPAYVGQENPGGGFVILKVTRVIEPATLDEAKLDSMRGRLAQLYADEGLNSVVKSLRARGKVEVREAVFAKKDEQ